MGLKNIHLLGFIFLAIFQGTLASNVKDQNLFSESKSISDEEFDVMMDFMIRFMVNSREEIKSMKSSIQVVQEMVKELNIRIETLENLSSHLNDSLIQTRQQLARVSSELNSLQSSAVTNIKLGPVENMAVWNGPGYVDTYGYVITGMDNYHYLQT